MKHVSTAAILAASTALATMPRAVHALPRADATGDVKAIIANLQKSFEDFKAAHDEKLSAKADVVVNDKVEKIDAAVGNFQAAIDEINAKLATAMVNVGDANAPQDAEYTKAWASWFRGGDDEAAIKAKARQGVYAAMSVGSSPDGGYFAPVEWDRTVTSRLKEISPIRQNARVQTISGAGFRKMYSDRSIGSGWVGETASRPATSTPTISPLDFNPGEIYAFPFASRSLLDDSEVNIEQWLGSEIDTEFSRQENIAFISGDGVNKPFGLLTYVTGAANAAKHPWGAIQLVNSGTAAAFTSDGFIDLFYSLPAAFRMNAKLYGNRFSQSGMRKLKDGQGNYLWQPSFAAGQPATLGGETIVEVPDMPNVAANAVPVLYGDMDATYIVVDRIGIRVIRDELTNKPFVGFYTTKRVGGGVYNTEPMRGLKISA